MKLSELEKIEKLVELLVEQALQDSDTNLSEEAPKKQDKQRVEKFFDRLGKSPLSAYMTFKTPQEQAQAIVRFANMVGVPKSQLSKVMASLRSSSKGTRSETE